MDTASHPTANPEAPPALIRCDSTDDLPSFMSAVLAVVEAGSAFGWHVDYGTEVVLGFVIDKAGSAYRIRLPDGLTNGLFVDFSDAIAHGAMLSTMAMIPTAQQRRRRPALSATVAPH